jgi:ribosomal-protein-alanine N-acetyltransferase
VSGSTLIQASVAHASVLAALHAASFPHPWSAAEFAALLQQPGVAGWIAGDNPPAGFILVRAAADEAEILTLAVAPARRRKGIASDLLKESCDALSAGGGMRLFLEVAADNQAAIALYACSDFAPCGRRADYYGGNSSAPVDALVMKRILRS